MTQLHSSLKITSQQEDQWSKFADVMRDNAHTMGDLYRQRLSQRDTMSARARRHEAIRADHAGRRGRHQASGRCVRAALHEPFARAEEACRYGVPSGRPRQGTSWACAAQAACVGRGRGIGS
ncbi:Spy/CpxP family protein refolding chaperone [Candidatus Burkholderia verschuerenii]|uniref:Spy/CpxP family protein refolding chaperone n=1 Tax=Candidatus Burkholderia verschuerenii TaxID=242163 RepID=UPI0034DD8274